MGAVKPTTLKYRRLGRQPYIATLEAMRAFTDQRGPGTGDELWLLEHDPVFTQGLAGRAEHVLDAGTIPVVASDRGGQVTYHGPGQLVVYCLLDLRRAGLGVRALVTALEESVIELLAGSGQPARARADAPGVYLPNGAKIASLGLRVRRGCSYHGLSLNVNMDLSPFLRINPCGQPGLTVTQFRDLGLDTDMWKTGAALLHHMARRLGYNAVVEEPSGLPPATLSKDPAHERIRCA